MPPSEPTLDEALPDQPLEVLLDAGSCLAVNKPAGVLTQAPAGIDSMEWRVRQHWQQESGKSYRLYVGVPHRLDRPVSGVLLFARNIRATQRLARQFEQRTLEKIYIALVEGRPPATGDWLDSLKKLPGRAWVQVATQSEPGAKPARLVYRVLGVFGSATLVAVQPTTGRTHQIRVQFAHRGFPVVGDHHYGASQSFGRSWSDPRRRSIALHARSLRFQHPTLAGEVQVHAPFGTDWWAIAKTIPAQVEAWERAGCEGTIHDERPG